MKMTQKKLSVGQKSNLWPPHMLNAPWTQWVDESEAPLVFHSMKPPPAGVLWRLTLRLPSSPRAPAAMAGPRGRIDLSTLPCQQPLGHNLTWKRVEPHPPGSPGWRMRRRVHVCAAKTLRGKGDTLHEEWIRQAQKKKKEKKPWTN